MAGSCSKDNMENCETTETISRSVLENDRESELINVGGDSKERACDSLVMCIVTTLNQGLRNGGGIGDILRAPSSTVSIFKFITSKVF